MGYLALFVDLMSDFAQVDQQAVVIRSLPDTDERFVELLIRLLHGISYASVCLEESALGFLKTTHLNAKKCRTEIMIMLRNVWSLLRSSRSNKTTHSSSRTYTVCCTLRYMFCLRYCCKAESCRLHCCRMLHPYSNILWICAGAIQLFFRIYLPMDCFEILLS